MENILWVGFTAEARKKQLALYPTQITTFRKGAKWLRPELVGQKVQLINCGVAHKGDCTESCELFATGTVFSVKACAFKNISLEDHYRQSGDMTVEDRLNIMRRVYGEYDEYTLTTVITLDEVKLV